MKKVIAIAILLASTLTGLYFTYIIGLSVYQLFSAGFASIENKGELFVAFMYLILWWSSYTSYIGRRTLDPMHSWLND